MYKKTKKNTKPIIKKTKTNYRKTARIIIRQNFGGFVQDMITIKNILENQNFKVDIVIYEEVKDKILNNQIKYKHVNIQFFIEHVYVEKTLQIFPANKSYIFINQEYMSDWDLTRIKDKTIIPLCKTHFSHNYLKKLGINTSKYIGFGNNNNILLKNITKIPNLFIHIAGQSPLKGTINLIQTWHNKNINEPLIIIAKNTYGGNTKLFNYWNSLHPTKINGLPNIENLNTQWKTHLPDMNIPKFENVKSIYLCNDTLDSKIITFLQNITTVHMCPSAIEGWGQYIDEGRRTKSIVATLNAPPMNELIDKKSGILINAKKGQSIRKILPYSWTKYLSKYANTDTYTANINDMYNSIKEIIKMTNQEKITMGENAFTKSNQDYNFFENNLIKLL